MIDVNKEYFDNINTKEKAYWLGYIWADGYSARKAPWFLCIQTKDQEHLKQFSDHISYTGNIKKVTTGGFENSSEMGRLVICRKYLCDKINSLGRYDEDMKIPNIQTRFIKDFIRGYFDGDGSVYTYIKSGVPSGSNKKYSYNRIEVSIIGTKSILEDIESELNKHSIKTRYKKSKTDYMFYLVISNKPDVKKFYEYLYDKSNVFLERKHQIFQDYYMPHK
jgi:hypothetical protein